jgi:hypothetical protein
MNLPFSITKLSVAWCFNTRVGMFSVRSENGPVLERALKNHDSSELPAGPFAIWCEPQVSDYEAACYRAWGIVRNRFQVLTGEMALHLMLGLTTPSKILKLVAPDQLPPDLDMSRVTCTPILNPNETKPMTQYQPETLQHDGQTYRLVTPARRVSEFPQTTEGPFYSREGVDPQDWAFMPDARFLAGLSGQVPSFMHTIQQRQNPTSPRPT